MSRAQPVQWIAERLIRASCRRLPEDERAERCREWSAELPAILDDVSVRLPVLRAVRALRYSAGVSRTTRYLRRAGPRAPRPRVPAWRDGAIHARPTTPAVRLVLGVASWLIVVVAATSLVRVSPQPLGWGFILVMVLAAAFDVFCLVDIVRASQVRYLPKWAWALICLAQAPSGGIAYLCIGRARPAPPSPAQRP